MTFEMVKKNYDRKLWNKEMVKIAVVKGVITSEKGVITSEQYKEITGDDYVAPTTIPKSLQQTVAQQDEELNELAGV